ncbi:MAG: UvrD-helicase domain-containing protein [Candidatus Cloacimonetes bacterium]|nr:UvrD-helicase domain-containing protein [Candidatus Cloacimonadota bacterium]MDY0172142.1 UvrD-helicase domain-containing protein [Candidatus Cloacimonadaceae bacterium]
MVEISELSILSHIDESEKLFLPNGYHFDQESINFIKCLESTDVVACPGSGKTTALLAKLFIMSKFMPFDGNKGICVLTHTNVAIDEIKRRMGKASSVLFTYPNFFGTIQSFVDRFLAIPAFVSLFGSREIIIDDDVYDSRFWKSVKQAITDDNKFWNNGYIYNLLTPNEKTLSYNDQRLPKYLIMSGFHPIWTWDNEVKLSFIHVKKNRELTDIKTVSYKFIEKLVLGTVGSGVIRFIDAFNLGLYYISRYPQIREVISHRFNYLFIDEMQDTDQRQNDLMNKVFTDSVVKQRIGDPNQAIYDNKVSDVEAWALSDQRFTISTSKRISSQIAKAIHNVCIKPEDSLEGVDRGTNYLFSPVFILYDDDSQSIVLSKFCELIKEREGLWKSELETSGKIPVYYAVGWTHDKEETTTGGEEKTSVKSYFPEYHRPVRSGNPIYDSLKNYLVKPIGSQSQLNPSKISNSLLSSFLRVLSEGDKTNPTNGKRYTQRSLVKFLKNDEEFDSDFKTKMALWVKQIAKHACDKTSCFHKDDVYPHCVFEQIIQYLKETWLPYFEIDEAQVSQFITNPIEQMENTSSVSNIFSSNSIDIQVGTVHSVKGQTHTATLFLECFSYDFNGNQLHEYLTGDKTFSSKDGKNKKCALKVAYVAMSRPTHFLCAAFHKDRIPSTTHKKLEELGWSLVTI